MESQEGIEGNLMELRCPKLTSVSYAHMDTWLMSHKYCWAVQKFRQEDQKLSGSEAFMRRSDSLKRAEQKAQEESERLRQQEREQLAEKRKNDLTLRANLAARADEKQLELLFLQWTEHHTHLCSFLRTTAEPAIYFMPAKPSEETDKLLQESQQVHC
jgi:pinin